ncbi:hypothetical protein E3N88_16552 [Mikania micrantha]|uniref:Uncharacterized protein n=1 Tax=Mikania micrantha TaxID=192012 RepID=A0A5N6NZ39_9ASTR|nr:hypothetical protein E3N88_16552 [Mikania micrantha]
MAKDDTTSDHPPSKPSSLHPAYSVSNIQTKIRTLDGTKVTYSSWVALFCLHVVAYKVLNHIDGTPTPVSLPVDAASWQELDALVLQWIYSTVSDDQLIRILDAKNTALAAWLKLERIYLSNKKACAAALETKFCNLSLTTCSSVEEYCQCHLFLNPGVDWDQAISMLNDEVLRLEAHKGSATTVLTAPQAPTQPQPQP